jgi:hypothetical protein
MIMNARSSGTKKGRWLWRRSGGNRVLEGRWRALHGPQLVQPAMLLCGAAAAAVVLHAFGLALGDSHDNDWGAARALLQGVDPYKAYLACAAACRKTLFLPPVAPMYPASGLVLLWPFAILSWRAAKIAWAALNLFFGIGLVVLLRQLFLPRESWRSTVAVIAAFVAGAPFLTNLEIGQHAVFALGWFAIALWAERRGNAALVGVLLAASWFKYTLTLPLSLIFVLRSRWPVLLAAVVIHAVLTLFAAIWTGSSPLDLLLGPLRVVQVVHRAGQLDAFGLAMRLGLASTLIPLAVALVLTTCVLAAAWRTRAEADLTLLALFSLLAYVVVYHLAYDLVILVIPLFYAMSRVRSWPVLAVIERVWIVMIAILLGWTWFADHLVQLLKLDRIRWVLQAYPFYYAATAVWFYATLAVGILVVGRFLGRQEPLSATPTTAVGR